MNDGNKLEQYDVPKETSSEPTKWDTLGSVPYAGEQSEAQSEVSSDLGAGQPVDSQEALENGGLVDLPSEENLERKNEQELNEAQKIEVEQQLDAAKTDLERLRANMIDVSEEFKMALFELDEITQGGDQMKDVDLLEYKLNALKRAHEELEASARKFALNNSNYDLDVVNGSKNLPRERFEAERKYVTQNEDTITDVARAARGADEKIFRIQQLISNMRRSGGE
ncbi:hypothetical protein IKE98_00720 [Candidatus Saccharibacteria bacterium]|nr:hypothetical protein [Candidatus Saccharibacteria bacterium]